MTDYTFWPRKDFCEILDSFLVVETIRDQSLNSFKTWWYIIDIINIICQYLINTGCGSRIWGDFANWAIFVFLSILSSSAIFEILSINNISKICAIYEQDISNIRYINNKKYFNHILYQQFFAWSQFEKDFQACLDHSLIRKNIQKHKK